MIATSGFLAALECIKFVFGRGSAPELAEESLQRSPDPVEGAYFYGGGEGEEKGTGKGKERKGPDRPPYANS